MDKFNFVRDGMVRLPPGFRFQPTDEELVFQYLKCKIFSWPLPASIIPEINVCKYDPWDLPGDLEQDKYFFSNKEAKYPNGNRINRATASGYWKATGVDKQIVSSRGNQIAGMKKTLVFYKGRSPNGSRTDWVMHEYRLVHAGTVASNFRQTNNSTQNISSKMEDWVLCRIFLRKRTMKDDDEIIDSSNDNKTKNAMVAQPRFYDFMGRDKTDHAATVSSASSSSSSSGITEVTSIGSDHEENSCRNVF